MISTPALTTRPFYSLSFTRLWLYIFRFPRSQHNSCCYSSVPPLLPPSVGNLTRCSLGDNRKWSCSDKPSRSSPPIPRPAKGSSTRSCALVNWPMIVSRGRPVQCGICKWYVGLCIKLVRIVVTASRTGHVQTQLFISSNVEV